MSLVMDPGAQSTSSAFEAGWNGGTSQTAVLCCSTMDPRPCVQDPPSSQYQPSRPLDPSVLAVKYCFSNIQKQSYALLLPREKFCMTVDPSHHPSNRSHHWKHKIQDRIITSADKLLRVTHPHPSILTRVCTKGKCVFLTTLPNCRCAWLVSAGRGSNPQSAPKDFDPWQGANQESFQRS